MMIKQKSSNRPVVLGAALVKIRRVFLSAPARFAITAKAAMQGHWLNLYPIDSRLGGNDGWNRSPRQITSPCPAWNLGSIAGLLMMGAVGLLCVGCAGPGQTGKNHAKPAPNPARPMTPQPTHDPADPIDPPPLGQNSRNNSPNPSAPSEGDADLLQPPHVRPDERITLSDQIRWEGVTTRLAPADATVWHYPIYVRSAGKVVNHTPPTEAYWVEDRMEAALDDYRADDYTLSNTARLLLEPPWGLVQIASIPPRSLLTFPWLPQSSP